MKIQGLHAKLIAEQYEDLLSKKGYKFFDGFKSFNVNIIGVRSNINLANNFDDMLLCIYRDEEKEWEVMSSVITCDPGMFWLRQPSKVEGAAILVPGQYKAWKIDKHQGKYDALCQRLSEVPVYRDNNLDNVLDSDDVPIDTGWHGINIHHAGVQSIQVGKWSAGCQVFANLAEFKEFMDVIKKSSRAFGNAFTYTLLTEDDLY